MSDSEPTGQTEGQPEGQTQGHTQGQTEGAADPTEGENSIPDEKLPEDLQPTDDNPLAKPPSDDEDDDEGGISLGPDGPQV